MLEQHLAVKMVQPVRIFQEVIGMVEYLLLEDLFSYPMYLKHWGLGDSRVSFNSPLGKTTEDMAKL